MAWLFCSSSLPWCFYGWWLGMRNATKKKCGRANIQALTLANFLTKKTQCPPPEIKQLKNTSRLLHTKKQDEIKKWFHPAFYISSRPSWSKSVTVFLSRLINFSFSNNLNLRERVSGVVPKKVANSFIFNGKVKVALSFVLLRFNK